jgi:hypothetical protein
MNHVIIEADRGRFLVQAGLGVGGQGFSYDSLRREVYTRLDQDPMGPSLSPEDDQV